MSMTENEIKKATIEDAIYCAKAMACLEVCEECRFYGLCHTWCDDVYGIMIEALEEVKAYRAIGTVESLKNLPAICDSLAESSEKAEKLIEELQQYRAIGTVEELQKIKGVITDFPIDCGSPISNVEEIWNQLKKYLAIGTIEDFKSLKEKNEPKKARFYAHNHHCSVCENLVGNNEFEWQRFLYCDNCGQKLDWSE